MHGMGLLFDQFFSCQSSASRAVTILMQQLKKYICCTTLFVIVKKISVHLLHFCQMIALNGDFVGVYQDVFVEMIESEGNSYMHDDIETSNMDTQLVFRVNKPFLFMLRMDHELLGLGRIKVN
jgi:hypothetical protein